MTTSAIVVMTVSIGAILTTFSFCLIKVLNSPVAEPDED
jgi:hypothetical protein